MKVKIQPSMMTNCNNCGLWLSHMFNVEVEETTVTGAFRCKCGHGVAYVFESKLTWKHVPPELNEKRKEGYYKVQIFEEGIWEVAFYSVKTKRWNLIGNEDDKPEDLFHKIGEPIDLE